MSVAVARFTVGKPGSGKSFTMVREIVKELLPNSDCRIYTNLPVNVETIAEYVATRRRSKVTYNEVLERLQLIPREVCEKWKSVPDEKTGLAESGPWEYFGQEETPTDNSVVILDECDAWVGTAATKETKVQWRNWVSELRHLGMRVEFLVQDWENIYSGIMRFCELRRSIVNESTARDPIFKIPMADIYEIRAKFFTGQMLPRVTIQEERSLTPKKWEMVNEITFTLSKEFFTFYNSYNDPIKSKGKGVGAKKYEFQKRSGPDLVRWFLLRNGGRIFLRVFLFGALMWFLAGGGLAGAIDRLTNTVSSRMEAGSGKHVQASEKTRLDTAVAAAAAVAPTGPVSPGSVVAPDGSVRPRPGLGELIEREGGADLTIHTIPDAYKAPVTADFLKVTAEQDEPMAVMRSEVADLFGKVDEQREQIEALETELARTKAAVYITGISPGRVFFSDGSEYHQLDKIRDGEYKGLIIYEIDYKKRRIRLSNGEYVRPGMRNGPANSGGVAAGISGAVRAIGSTN